MTSVSRSILPTSLQSAALRDALDRHRASLQSRLEDNEDGMALGQANARFLNACFKTLFEGAARMAGLPRGVALAAVGSFGRGAVALRSDADVVLVVDSSVVATDEASELASALLYPLWDANLPVGHQVLSAADAVMLAQRDLATATALLDLRLLGGDELLLRGLVARAHEGLFGEEASARSSIASRARPSARHERFGGSVYLLEPDVKNGAGALRDLDGARWAACARYRGEPGDVRKTKRRHLGELVRIGVLVAREAHEIAEAEELLWRVRNRLHARAGAKADRLASKTRRRSPSRWDTAPIEPDAAERPHAGSSI
jgi:[protein-PII] uridylyltransferase